MTLELVKRCGRFQGQKELILHLQGKRLSYKKACLAKCFECMGGYADGAMDCRITDCALYSRMPYQGKNPLILSPDTPNSTL